MFHSSHLIFVKQCFLLTSFGSWFWCYLGSFSFLCLQLVTLQVVQDHIYGFFLILTMSFQGTIISLYSLLERISRLIVVSATVSACLCMLMKEDIIIQDLCNKHILILSMYCKNYQTQNLMEQVTYYANVEKYLTAFAIFTEILQKLQRKLKERYGVQDTYSIISYNIRRLSPT